MRTLFVSLTAPLLAVLLAVPANADSRDEELVQQMEAIGISIDTSTVNDMAEIACESPSAGIGYYNVLQEVQQQYPEYSLNEVALVMANSKVAYCPERLGR